MNYLEFIYYVKKEIENRLGQEVCIRKVTKTNLGEMDSLSITNKDNNSISPIFYLQKIYAEYIEGKDADSLVDEMIKIYKNCMQNKKQALDVLDFMNDYEKSKAKIFFKIINKNKNRELLENTPHFEYHDLAMVFCLLVSSDTEEIATIRIEDKMLACWGVSVEEIRRCALENTPRLFPLKKSGLYDMVASLLGENTNELPEMKSDMDVYVLTNTAGINGFSAVFYPDELREMALELGGDFYILPSSIHEALIIKKGSIPVNDLMDMVKEVNCSCVQEEDKLSDNIYRYSYADETMYKVLGEEA